MGNLEDRFCCVAAQLYWCWEGYNICLNANFTKPNLGDRGMEFILSG